MKNIRIGILGASQIAPFAFIKPAQIVNGVFVGYLEFFSSGIWLKYFYIKFER